MKFSLKSVVSGPGWLLSGACTGACANFPSAPGFPPDGIALSLAPLLRAACGSKPLGPGGTVGVARGVVSLAGAHAPKLAHSPPIYPRAVAAAHPQPFSSHLTPARCLPAALPLKHPHATEGPHTQPSPPQPLFLQQGFQATLRTLTHRGNKMAAIPAPATIPGGLVELNAKVRVGALCEPIRAASLALHPDTHP